MMIQTGQNEGMQTMNTCLKNMYLNGIIDENTMIEAGFGGEISPVN
jgi:Tfp pilus assembly pilus retraction ATPase PilT